MKPRWLLVAMVAVGAGSLACAGIMATPEQQDNARACEAWVEHMNDLECVALIYDADEMCAGANTSPADMAAYFDCARAHSRCEEGKLVNDLNGCRQPTM